MGLVLAFARRSRVAGFKAGRSQLLVKELYHEMTT